MPTLISSGKEIGFTILPYSLDTPLEQELITNPSDNVLGYITRNKETGDCKFTYTESGGLTEANNHWSLAIIKEFPYCENDGPWILYNCSPVKVKLAFSKIISKYNKSLHVDNWDTWSVEGKDAKVSVITSFEMF